MGRKIFVFILVLLLAVSAYAASYAPTSYNRIASGSTATVSPGTPVVIAYPSGGLLYLNRMVVSSHDTGIYVTRDVVVGASNISAGLNATGAGTAKVGIRLTSYDSAIVLPVGNPDMVYVDTCNTADGVTWTNLY